MLKKATFLAVGIFLWLGMSTQVQATIYFVDSANGNDSNPCTAQNAACKTINATIDKATDGDTIKIASNASSYQEAITLSKSLTLEGTGQKASEVTIEDSTSIAALNLYADITIRNLTIKSNGYLGVISSGNVTLEKVIVTGKNSGTYCGGAIMTGPIPNITLTIKDSTITGSTTKDNGAGICARSKVVVINSTISGNEAVGNGDPNTSYLTGMGGAVYLYGGEVHFYNSTITQNKAVNKGGGLYADPGYDGNITLDNTILSDNTVKGVEENCNNGVTFGGSNNLEKANTCQGPLFTVHADPTLDILKDNGGATPTHALLAGSPAIDKGDVNGCKGPGSLPLDNDQRGQQRVERCDIGSFEYVPPGWQPPPPPTGGTGGTGQPPVPGTQQPAPSGGTVTTGTPPTTGGTGGTGGTGPQGGAGGGCTLHKGDL